MFTFILDSVRSFSSGGFCNGMIDVMDKHFQDELHLSKSRVGVGSVCALPWVLSDVPSCRMAGFSKLGYKGGIITGLLIVALGGFWVHRLHHINAMVPTKGQVSS